MFPQAAIQHRPGNADIPTRVPAHDVEAVVCTRLGLFLGRPSEILNALSDSGYQAAQSNSVVGAANRRAALWVEQSPSEKRAFLLATMARITIHEKSLDVEIDKTALGNALLRCQHANPNGRVTDASWFRLTVEARVERRGGAVRLIALSRRRSFQSKQQIDLAGSY